jgi:hypothetical protein
MPALLTILSPQTGDREEIACSTSRGWGRFKVAGGLLVISLLCLVWGEPRLRGTALSVAFFAASLVSMFVAGIATRVVFSRDAKRVKITKTIFERVLVCQDHPYDEVSWSVRIFFGGDLPLTPLEYVVTVGGKDYVLNLPLDCPASEERLPEVRARFGFENEPNKSPLPTPGSITPAAGAPVAQPPRAADR